MGYQRRRLGPAFVLTGVDMDRIIQICCRADTATWYTLLCSPPLRDSHAALLGIGVGQRVIQQVHGHGGRVSSECGSATALDGLNLLDSPGGPAEAGRELVAVEEEALGRLDGRQSGARGTANATLTGTGPGLLEGAILLGALAILGEGAGEVTGERLAGAGRVRPRGVVDGGCCRTSKSQHGISRMDAEEAGGIFMKRDDLQGMERFPMNRIEGTRSAWAAACRRTLVANILTVCVCVCMGECVGVCVCVCV